MPPASRAVHEFLQSAHLRARGLLLVWALSLSLLGCAIQFFPVLGLASPHPALPALLAFSALAVTAIWIRRARALSPVTLARDLDRDWTLAARLESSAELAGDSSALAAAQRADTARHLAGRRPPRGGAWLSALALVVLSALLLLTETAILAYRHFSHAASVATSSSESAPDLSTTLVWKSPEPEIKATAIEEIPLSALVTTRGGLRSLSLEIAVNGIHRLSSPLDPAALRPFASPGEHVLDLSLYLDELGVQEFDLVSYHLRAERISSSSSLPPVASPLQFVQIRPAREDVARMRMPPGPSGQMMNLLTALKAAQLQLLKQNFLLAHAPIDHARSEWRDENARVANDQKTLAAKTAEAREFAIAEGFPALVVDNLGQSQPLMEIAAAKISASENEPAAEPQGQALALIVATEKIIRKVIIESSATGAARQPPSVRDPFKDSQQFKLPSRASTPAGQLEQLAQEQGSAAQNLADPAAAKAAEAQTELARKLAELAASRSLDSSAQGKTEQAARDAAEAASQLRQNDREAARAPATAAAEALRAATAAQEAAGRAAAEAELEQIRRALNAAERAEDSAERAAALAQAAEKLRAEAAAQQQTGSAAAARELAAAAAKVARAAAESSASAPGSAPKSSPSGQGSGSEPKPPPGSENSPASPTASSAGSVPSASGSPSGEAASAAATRAQAALAASRDQSLSRAIRQLGRAGTGSVGELAELELGAQLAAELVKDPTALGLARQVARDARRHQDEAANLVRIPADLRDSVDRLVVLLEAARHAGRRDEQVRRYNPDDIAPAYRPVVETYFEKLSREAK